MASDDDLDDLLNSALDEVEEDDLEESRANNNPSSSSSDAITSALSEAAATNAKTQTESAAKAAESAAAAGAGGDGDIANLLKMFSGEDGGGDFDKMLSEMFKDLNVDDLISKLGEGGPTGANGEPDLSELVKLLGGEAGEDLSKLFAASGPGGAGGGAPPNEEEMAKLLDQMMKSVMRKELMHDPVKQICQLFPAHLAKNDIPPQDRKRYEQQHSAYRALLAEFEVEGETNTDRVALIMRDLETYGQPPPEVMKLVGGPGGMPGLGGPGGGNNENPCPTQ